MEINSLFFSNIFIFFTFLLGIILPVLIIYEAYILLYKSSIFAKLIGGVLFLVSASIVLFIIVFTTKYATGRFDLDRGEGIIIMLLPVMVIYSIPIMVIGTPFLYGPSDIGTSNIPPQSGGKYVRKLLKSFPL